MEIKLVVFDMAGTTVKDDHEVEACFEKSLIQAGLNISKERILAVQGLSKRYVFKTLWTEKLGEGHPDLEKAIEDNYQNFKEILEAYYRENPTSPQPYAEELFSFLRKNDIKIVLTTGFYREITDIILEQLGWDKGLNEDYISNGDGESVIDFSISSDQVEEGRPSPDMIFMAMKAFGINDPKQVVKIGDTPSDLEEGKAADVGLIYGVLNGTHNEEQLSDYPYTKLLPDLKSFQSEIEEHLVTI